MSTNLTPWTQFPIENRFAYAARDLGGALIRPFRVTWVVSSSIPGNCGWVYRSLFFTSSAEAIAVANRPMNARSVSVHELPATGQKMRHVFGRKNNSKRKLAA